MDYPFVLFRGSPRTAPKTELILRTEANGPAGF